MCGMQFHLTSKYGKIDPHLVIYSISSYQFHCSGFLFGVNLHKLLPFSFDFGGTLMARPSNFKGQIVLQGGECCKFLLWLKCWPLMVYTTQFTLALPKVKITLANLYPCLAILS